MLDEFMYSLFFFSLSCLAHTCVRSEEWLSGVPKRCANITIYKLCVLSAYKMWPTKCEPGFIISITLHTSRRKGRMRRGKHTHTPQYACARPVNNVCQGHSLATASDQKKWRNPKAENTEAPELCSAFCILEHFKH